MSSVTYEFVIPSHVHLIDPLDWEPIAVVRSGVTLRVKKPVVGQELTRVPGTIGNEGVDVHYSIMRVEVDGRTEQEPFEWRLPFSIARECLMWIRVAGRQYWLGTLANGTKTVARGSVITKQGHYSNFSALRNPIILPPLENELWKSIGMEMVLGRVPSIPDLMFCDALLANHEADYLQAVIQLGVTCEIELNAFIDDLLSIQTEIVQRLFDERAYRFTQKLKQLVETLGSETFDRANQLCQLYELRGKAVHRAECLVEETDRTSKQKSLVPIGSKHISEFVFAVERFMSWTKAQRKRLGIPTSNITYYSINAIAA